jgi:hypothetical protein
MAAVTKQENNSFGDIFLQSSLPKYLRFFYGLNLLACSLSELI